MRKKLSVLIICLLFFSVQVFAQLHFPPRFLKIPEILLKERTTAPSASSHYGTFYVKAADGLPYFKTSAGVEHGLAMAVSVGDYLDLPEISEPGTPDATELRLWVQDFHGFSLYSYKDDGGMVRRVGDNVYIGVNNTGSTIPALTAVYAAGNDLDPLPAAVELAPAKADDAATMPCIGVTVEPILDGAYGRYMATGIIEGKAAEPVNTSAFSVGDTIYVSKDTAGAFTAVKPVYPNIPQEMGTILVDSATLGQALIVARAVGTGIIVGVDVPALAHTMASHSDDDTYNISTSGTAAMGATSIGGVTPVAGTKLLLPSENEPATPTLAFGDGNTGFYESADNTLRVAFAGVLKWEWAASKFYSRASYGPGLHGTTPTSTLPTVLADYNDLDTGIGAAAPSGAADQLSLIAGGVEGIRITEDTTIAIDLNGEVNSVSHYGTMQTATGDGTTTVDWGLGNIMYFTFGAQNDAFTFTPPANKGKVTLIIKQDGVGSRTIDWSGVTVLWPGNVEPTLTTTAAAVDIVTFIYDGSSWLGLFNGDFR